jgi:hypothetical protein
MERLREADIVFIRTSMLGSADPKLIKEAVSLKEHGYKVIILALRSLDTYKKEAYFNEMRAHKCLNYLNILCRCVQ